MSSNESVDLSLDEDSPSGSLPPIRPPSNVVAPILEEMRHLHAQQKTVVSAALCFTAVLFIAAVVIAFVSLCNLNGAASAKDIWRLSAFTSGFLIAGTVIILVVVRSVHPTTESSSEKDEGNAAFKWTQDLVAGSAALVNSAVDIVKAVGKK